MSWLGWLDSLFKDRIEGMDISLARLSESWKKKDPACDCCGYDAEWLLTLGSLERFFCERDLLNVLFDAVNFATFQPGGMAYQALLPE